MRTPILLHSLTLCLLLAFVSPLWASDLLMVRSPLPFPQAQPYLEETIQDMGYVVSESRRVDIDLVVSGFGSGNYRAISYGRPEEILSLSERYPELTPFLPPQVVVFGERNTSLLVAVNPLYLKRYFSQPELAEVFERWNRDLESILERVRDVGR